MKYILLLKFVQVIVTTVKNVLEFNNKLQISLKNMKMKLELVQLVVESAHKYVNNMTSNNNHGGNCIIKENLLKIIEDQEMLLLLLNG